MEKRPFFRAAMAGLGIYHTGGYGRIGVYRDLDAHFIVSDFVSKEKQIVFQ